MEAVAIIAPAGTKISRFSSLLADKRWHVEQRSADEAFVEDADARAYLLRDEHLMEEYDGDEIDKVLRLVPNPIFFALDFSDISLAKAILLLIADADDLGIDDTHGTILRGSQFAKRLRAEPNWDWRKGTVRD